MNKNLLWEIGTEELPARFINPALESLKSIAEKKLKEARLNFEEIKCAGTLRRLVLFVKNLAEKQEDIEEEILGPPKKVGVDKNGNFTQAALGFAKKYGVSPKELSIKHTEKGEYICLKRKILGKATLEILPQLLLEILENIYFPKSMRWGNYKIKFGRPIRWILCLYGKDIVPLEIANVKSSNFTRGHRFLTKNPILIEEANWEKYENILEKNFVIVDPLKRILKTKEEIEKVSKEIGIPEIDEKLIEENANLVEYPFAVVGKFSTKFLTLPEPLIITALKEHQKYICIRDKNLSLLNYFIAVNNNLPEKAEIVKKGHEKVTNARLEDAKFYFEKDLQTSLDEKVEKLKGIVYYFNCGTLWDKTQRLVKLGEYIAKKLNLTSNLEKIKKACFYAKADLASEVVSEFPSLQGIMGSIYVEYSGEREISKAIYEQYLPLPQEEKFPETQEGIVLSLADKIDHICALFGSGERPTGEADPYGLRRSAYGIIKTLIEKKIFLDLEEIVKFSLRILEEQKYLHQKEIFLEILLFLKKRFEGELLSLGFDKHIINTVIDKPFDPFDLYLRAEALKIFQEQKEFADLITGFKRVAQILKGINIEGLPPLNPVLFNQKEEENLYFQISKLKPVLENLLEKKEYLEYLKTLLSLKEDIDIFFEKVFVMVDKKEIRENRLKLLLETASLFNSFGNFTYFI